MTLAIGNHTFPYGKNANYCQGDEPYQSLFTGRPEHFSLEERRVKTFLLWPSWAKADVQKLAETGFYFTGDDDKVKCYSCGVEISSWRDTESPESVHKRKSPDCELVKKPAQKSPKGSKRNKKKKGAANSLEHTGDDEHDNGSGQAVAGKSSIEHDATTFTSFPKATLAAEHPTTMDLKKEENRIQTFIGKWPNDSPLEYRQVAKAGFWYRGPHDRVECAWCRGRLVNWVPGDDPVGEHIRHFPACPFIVELNNEPLRFLKTTAARAIIMLGYKEDMVLMAVNQCKQEGITDPSAEQIQEAIFLLEDEKEAQKAAAVAKAAAAVAAASAASTPDHGELQSDGLCHTGGLDDEEYGSNMSAPEEVKELRKKNTELKMSTTCKVCLIKDVNCVFLPCRHLVCCAECANKVEFCPVCRQHIIGTVKTFMA